MYTPFADWLTIRYCTSLVLTSSKILSPRHVHTLKFHSLVPHVIFIFCACLVHRQPLLLSFFQFSMRLWLLHSTDEVHLCLWMNSLKPSVSFLHISWSHRGVQPKRILVLAFPPNVSCVARHLEASLNTLGCWPMSYPFDLLLYRLVQNVMIARAMNLGNNYLQDRNSKC